MTYENKFFRFLRRFNAIGLAAIGVVVACGVALAILTPWRPAELAPTGRFAPVPHDAEKAFTYRLENNGKRRRVGQEELVALDRWRGSPETDGVAESAVSSARYVQSRRVNLLAVDQVTAESHWLFKGYDRAIVADDTVYDSISLRRDQASSSPIALVMIVADSDTNKDGEMSEEDRQTLYVYRPGTAQAVRLLTADLIVSRLQTSDDRYLVIYENGSSAVAATFSIPEFKLIVQKPLPKVPNG
ncbi:MAG TPA: hypothetical protein VNX61_02705 [Rhizomicrobium sp.]|jgi:hypothetical protein|nr:hypothetical protein [Rhizomicrobium sp.]